MNAVRREKLKIIGYEALLITAAVLQTATRPNASLAFGAYDIREHDRLWAGYAKLNARGLVRQRAGSGSGDGGAALWELTEAGNLELHGGRDLASRWDRAWDGHWCLFSYDAPAGRTDLRQRLRRWLRDNDFGLLQQSVWVAADAAPELEVLLGKIGLDPCDGIAFRAEAVGKNDPGEIVGRAWDFPAIAAAQAAYISFAKKAARKVAKAANPAAALVVLAAEDREKWIAAFHHDPLLPRVLWPDGYRGSEACEARRALLGAVARG